MTSSATSKRPSIVPAAEAGVLVVSREIAKALNGATGGELSIWVAGNRVERRPVKGIDGDRISFGGGPITLYHDRPDRVAAVNAPALIAAPGDYATLRPGVAVAWLRDRASLSVGTGRRGFELQSQSDIVVRGFVFQHYVAAKYGEGVQITTGSQVAHNVLITRNTFQHSSMYTGDAVLQIGLVEHSAIIDNRFEDLDRASGIKTRSKPVKDLTISGNSFSRLGQTAILVMGSENVKITRNTMDQINGVHGNGISLYLDNHDIEVSGNRVTNSYRPFTFHGEKGQAQPYYITKVCGNVFSSNDPGGAALVSFGDLQDVTITNNILIGPKLGCSSPRPTAVWSPPGIRRADLE